MSPAFDMIKLVDPTSDSSAYKLQLADCVIVTHDKKIIMQYRPLNSKSAPDKVVNFGGKLDGDENPQQALVRELHEELGAVVDWNDVVPLGVLTEDWTGHSELVHTHFWHDKDGTITGCYEGEPLFFENMQDALNHEKIMD